MYDWHVQFRSECWCERHTGEVVSTCSSIYALFRRPFRRPCEIDLPRNTVEGPADRFHLPLAELVVKIGEEWGSKDGQTRKITLARSIRRLSTELAPAKVVVVTLAQR
jgi:hypothetical protein